MGPFPEVLWQKLTDAVKYRNEARAFQQCRLQYQNMCFIFFIFFILHFFMGSFKIRPFSSFSGSCDQCCVVRKPDASRLLPPVWSEGCGFRDRFARAARQEHLYLYV